MPAYCRAIGPSLTFTVPANPDSSTEVTVAPGKQLPTRSRSMNVAQASSTLGRDGEVVRQLHAAVSLRGR